MRLLPLLLCLAALAARAEKADRDKPTEVEANRMSADDVRRLNIFEGKVVLTKGTMRVQADRIVVRQDAEGFQYATATGKPVKFRQRQDPKPPEKEGEWMDGEAEEIYIDERAGTVDLKVKARVNRGGDQVTGNHITVDQRSEFFSVKSEDGGRVRATIQPSKPPPDAKK
jgi:lipopolysaccharide export system protein LptA